MFVDPAPIILKLDLRVRTYLLGTLNLRRDVMFFTHHVRCIFISLLVNIMMIVSNLLKTEVYEKK